VRLTPPTRDVDPGSIDIMSPTSPTIAPSAASTTGPGALRSLVRRHPVLAFAVPAIGLTVALQLGLLVSGRDVLPGKVAELFILTGLAVAVTALVGGRAEVRRLYAGLLRWRIGVGRWLLVLFAVPAMTLAAAATTGTLGVPAQGWGGVAIKTVIVFLFVLLTASVWEEAAWTGLVQTRLMARSGLLRGSLLAAVPFCLVHLPLAFEADGWAGTTWSEALTAWAWMLAALPFFRYLAGMLLIDSRGSVLAVAVLHASFNAAGSMSVLQGLGTQYVPAMIIVTLAYAGYRRLRHRSSATGELG